MSVKDIDDVKVNPDFEDAEMTKVEDDVNVIDYSSEGDSLNDDVEISKEVKSKRKQKEKMVELFIPFDHVTGETHKKISINLKEFIIPIGETVKVPEYVRDYIDSLSKQKYVFNQQRKSKEHRDV